MSLKRGHDVYQQDDRTDVRDQVGDIFESSSIEDRASRFVGLFSPELPAKTLQAHPPYKKASHRILAWRKPSNQQSLSHFKAASTGTAASKVIYTTGHDDDGEAYAGKKLERLLIELGVVGAVVVARWYGGVLLGPVRFTHIENVAKQAIEKWRESTVPSSSIKKIKTDSEPMQLSPEEEAEQRNRLIKLLGNRDSSIVVLRGLLAEKNSSNTSASSNTRTNETQSAGNKAVPAPDYASMPLKKLQQLEKARDTTIAWILKRIDEAEAEAEANKSSRHIPEDTKAGVT